MRTYKGRYKPKNPDKYVGDVNSIVYRSMWERHVMKWCDDNSNVSGWVSEEVVIPYICQTDKRPHRYFMDFAIQFTDGKKILVEVKPFKETQRPENKQGKRRQTLLNESMTYIKNQSKWHAAQQYALDRGWHFEIWTEKELTALGIMPKSTQKPKGRAALKPLRKFSRKKPKK